MNIVEPGYSHDIERYAAKGEEEKTLDLNKATPSHTYPIPSRSSRHIIQPPPTNPIHSLLPNNKPNIRSITGQLLRTVGDPTPTIGYS